MYLYNFNWSYNNFLFLWSDGTTDRIATSYPCDNFTCRVGEKSMIKIHHRHWSAFFGYLYVMDLINAWKMEHIKMYTKLIWPQTRNSTGHTNSQLNLHVPHNAENILFSQETLSFQEGLCQMAFMYRFSKRIYEMGSHCKQGSTKKLNFK